MIDLDVDEDDDENENRFSDCFSFSNMTDFFRIDLLRVDRSRVDESRDRRDLNRNCAVCHE